MHLLEQAAIFLLAAVLLVPLFRRLKLGATAAVFTEASTSYSCAPHFATH